MSKKTNSLLITILLLLVIIAAGYVYFSGIFAKTTLELSPSSYSYFTTSEPEIEVVLNNPKNAKQGELAISYDTKVLKLQSSELADGVSITEQNETLLFELTEEYFKSNSRNAQQSSQR